MGGVGIRVSAAGVSAQAAGLPPCTAVAVLLGCDVLLATEGDTHFTMGSAGAPPSQGPVPPSRD